MKTRELKRAIWLPRLVAEIFPFFADPANLGLLTPSRLSFCIISPLPIKMRLGLLIDYRIAMLGLSFRWQSEIMQWNPPHSFIDEQRRGPYRFWRHEHRFLERDNGTEILDTVHYAVRFDSLVHRAFVRPELEHIFDFREQKVRELFGTKA